MSNSEESRTREVVEQIKMERTRERMKAVKWTSATGIVGVTMLGVGAWFITGNKIVVTDAQKVFILSVLAASVLFSPAVISGIKRLWSPNYITVIEVKAAADKVVDVWAGAPDLWSDVDIVDGDIHEYQIDNKAVKLVNKFSRVEDVDGELEQHIPDDTEGWVAAGSWIGEASDWEIADSRDEIRRNRRRNSLSARIGQKLYSTFESITRRIEQRHHKQIADQSMEMSTFSAESAKQTAVEEIPEIKELDNNTLEEAIDHAVDEDVQEWNRRENPGGDDL